MITPLMSPILPTGKTADAPMTIGELKALAKIGIARRHIDATIVQREDQLASDQRQPAAEKIQLQLKLCRWAKFDRRQVSRQ